MIDRPESEELSPESRMTLLRMIESETGLHADVLNDCLGVNTAEEILEFRNIVLQERHRLQQEAQMFSPRSSFEGQHIVEIDTRTNAEIFADFISEQF